MKNYNKLTNEQVQVALTATLGDGHMRVGVNSGKYETSCKMLDYISYKNKLLGELGGIVTKVDKNGYSQTYIYKLRSKSHTEFKAVHDGCLVDKLTLMDELGLALLMYDDGSRHKKWNFYNINTQSFNKEDNVVISQCLKEKFGIYNVVMPERKKDGKVFYYIQVPKFAGAHKLSDLMCILGVESYSYKLMEVAVHTEVEIIYNYVTTLGFKEGTLEHYTKSKQLGMQLSIKRKYGKIYNVWDIIKNN